jgi:transposase
VVSMPKTRPPYDEEFRREAVGLLARGERSLAALSKELGVSQQTLRTWRKRAGVEAGKVEGLTRDEREELRRVKRELRVVTEEREILKKALAFFAKDESR